VLPLDVTCATSCGGEPPPPPTAAAAAAAAAAAVAAADATPATHADRPASLKSHENPHVIPVFVCAYGKTAVTLGHWYVATKLQ
jgi:hypothetical protein